MPVSYKHRKGLAAKSRAVATERRMRSSINSSIQRSYGANMRRQLVSVPAALRARGGMATELKTIDYQADLEGSGSLTALNAFTKISVASPFILFDFPYEGSSFYNRIARRTRGVALHIKGSILPTLNNSSAKNMQYGRMLIVYDRQCNGAVPTASAILTDYNGGGSTTQSVHSGINPDNRDRFMVLRDRKFLFPPVGLNGVAPTTVSGNIITGNADMKDSSFLINEYIKLNGLETQYKASNTGSIGDISTGSILCLLIDELDATGTSAWCLSYCVRYSFYD